MGITSDINVAGWIDIDSPGSIFSTTAEYLQVLDCASIRGKFDHEHIRICGGFTGRSKIIRICTPSQIKTAIST